MSTTSDAGIAGDLASRISGSVLSPADDGYDAARAVHNGIVDRRPALIVRCRTADDVVAALEARDPEGARAAMHEHFENWLQLHIEPVR